jgi:hypothetical protein
MTDSLPHRGQDSRAVMSGQRDGPQPVATNRRTGTPMARREIRRTRSGNSAARARS